MKLTYTRPVANGFIAALSSRVQATFSASRLEQVIEVLHLTGAPDYQLRVACRDTAELDALLRALRVEHGAADTDTTIILRSGPPRNTLRELE